jgi:hypothetical protein
MLIFNCIFWFIALVASGLLGWKAVEIFTDVPKKEREEKEKEKQRPPSWWWQQRWFNFLGSIVGWAALWLLLRRYWTYILGRCGTDPRLWDLLAGFIAFVGITGYLPYTVYGLISCVYRVGHKLADSFLHLL